VGIRRSHQDHLKSYEKLQEIPDKEKLCALHHTLRKTGSLLNNNILMGETKRE
jgi:hypothetical protein